jgi:hypothetical protein
MICSRCGADKPDKAYPHNYGKRNGSTCLECRRKKYKTRVEVARSKLHEALPTRKKCKRCIDLGIKPPHPVKRGNYYFCEKCFEWASHHSDDCVGY